MKGEKGLMTSLPRTSPPQRVLFVVDILAKEQMLLRALKGEQEEAVGSDPPPFPPLFLYDGSWSVFGPRLPLGPQAKSYH